MYFSDKIIKKYSDMADRRVAAACNINIIFMLIVAVLNILGIFIIRQSVLLPSVAITIAIYMLPMIIHCILGIHSEWVRYFILFMLVLQTGLEYAVLSYHVILMLAFPIVIACLYSQKRYIIFTSVLEVPMVVISHIIALKLKVVPDEPLVTMKGTVLYGVVPRMIELLAFVVTCCFIASRIQSLINSVLQKNEELYADQENTLTSLSEIIESQSEHTGTHVKRVAMYTEVICKGLGFSDEESWKAAQASKMHDVGKIIVPIEILEKPGRLTPQEYEIVKMHADHGKKMLEKSPGELLQLASVIAYQHHERWDGTGYHGIKGEDINVFVRCVALADVFDALASKRPYKEPWSIERIEEEIINQRGKQFAPEVVDVFLAKIDEFRRISQMV